MSSTEPRSTQAAAPGNAGDSPPPPALPEGVRRHARRWPWVLAAAPIPLVAALAFPKFWILLTAYSGKLLLSGIALFLLHRRWAKRRDTAR